MVDHQVAELFQELRQVVANSLDSVKSQQFSLKTFERIFQLVQSVPMTSSEYQAMTRRARGALEYCLDAEYGAAGFDLRMLLRSIERLLAHYTLRAQECHVVTRKFAAAQPPSDFIPRVMRA